VNEGRLAFLNEKRTFLELPPISLNLKKFKNFESPTGLNIKLAGELIGEFFLEF
jgi:hypothetical protein